MTEQQRRRDQYLHAVMTWKQVIAKAVRERRATAMRRGVAAPLHWWFVLTVALAACQTGNKSPRTSGDMYAQGKHALEACCERVQGPGRDECLAEIPRVADRAAQRTATNQQTYACIVDRFTCDPATGRATPDSAQAQYDCIAELQ